MGAWLTMPVARYFVFVGGALLALLFAMNAYLSPSPLDTGANIQATQAAASDNLGKPYLRIRSEQKPPERVVIDTALPTIIPAATTVVAQAPAAVAKSATLDALAQVSSTQVASTQVASSDPKKSEVKRVEPKAPKRRVAKRQVSQPVIASAQGPLAYAQGSRFDFDFFGRN
jgi:hypothetical protein